MTVLVDLATVEPDRALSPEDFAKLGDTCPVCGEPLIYSFGLAFGGYGAYAMCDGEGCNFARKENRVETDDNESSFTNDELAGAITEEDLRQRSQALHEAQESWEEVAYLANPKMPCPECSGSGSVGGGSLGDICVRCMGARVLEQPGRQAVELPPFRELRAAISAYGDALADRALPEGHGAKKQLALPAAATVPTWKSISELTHQALVRARQLQGAPGVVDPKLLEDRKTAKGLAGEGDLGEYDDAELADMEE
jgi:ssDNA-binding Zn-finger/Zn-ribbon topoisomerase 1